jgi:hypothetical protein
MMKLAIFIFATFFSLPSFAQDFACAELLKVEKEFSAKLPIQIDEVTTLVEVGVNCTTKIVKYVKHLSVNRNQLVSGFAKRKQRQHINLHCNSQGLATKGWAAMDYIYDSELSLVVKLETQPSMCKS